MISRLAHQKVLAAVPRKEYRIRRYDDTQNGHGARQPLAQLRTHKNPPISYGTLADAMGALS
jgi:hypothetical protein